MTQKNRKREEHSLNLSPENHKEGQGPPGFWGKLPLTRVVRFFAGIGAWAQRVFITPVFFALLAAGVIVALFLPITSSPWELYLS